MCPKYNSGDIIGVKQVESRYLNYGSVYVVVMDNGEVYLKYVKKGQDDKHLLLESENPKYESKEWHLSCFRSFFVVKGGIRKASL